MNDAQLGLLLLCLGVGSLIGVSAAGLLAAGVGARPVVVAAGAGLCALLPPLAVAASPLALGSTLLLFGACLGALDVAMNAHGVQVETAADAPLMSGFHALYSLGGAAGAGWMRLSLRSHLSPLLATVITTVAALGLVAFGAFEATWIDFIGPRLTPVEGENPDGTSVGYADGVWQVSYDREPEALRSRVGDPVRICLVSKPRNCPSGDDRGRVYSAQNLRTHAQWRLPVASHKCGGA